LKGIPGSIRFTSLNPAQNYPIFRKTEKPSGNEKVCFLFFSLTQDNFEFEKFSD
jgi:hypothetical protein